VSDEVFETLWRAQGLDRVASSIALDQTVTARTLAAPSDAPPARTPSFTAPPLPSISLDLSSPGAVAAGGGLDDPSGPDLLVLDTLGEGGMGRVLLARQRSLARDVAVKVLKPETADADGALSLLREAVVMGGVEHPNIVPVHALGRDDRGHPVLVMKRIEGTSWRALLDDDAHPTWTALLAAHGDRVSAHLEVLMRVADAAHFAHARGVIHRDIKPENVMVGAFGEVYLVDWGIAIRVGRTQPDGDGAFRIRGTPAYMAPEMIGGDPTRLDARTDVYLLGATLHEVLTRTPRHRGARRPLQRRHARRPRPPPGERAGLPPSPRRPPAAPRQPHAVRRGRRAPRRPHARPRGGAGGRWARATSGHREPLRLRPGAGGVARQPAGP
jgi:serine/threonine-protein kinase